MGKMRTPEASAQIVVNELDIFEKAREKYAEAVRQEAAMEAHRPEAKLAAILRLMQTADPRYPQSIEDVNVGKPIKMLPATEAEKYVELDPEYASFLLNQRNLCHARMRAETEYQSAKVRAALHVTLTKSLLGVA